MNVSTGGQGGIRTPEDVSQQIYSLPHLTTLVPAHEQANYSENFPEGKGKAGKAKTGYIEARCIY